MAATRFDTADVRRYYDRHTAAFVRFGQGRAAIHRAVWAPATRTKDEAFNYVDEEIAALLRRLLPSTHEPHIVDLGCGVGASLCYLAERLPVRGTGITLSAAQAEIARRGIAAAGLSDRVVCLEGDYSELPATLPPADLAYAIESFVHAPMPERFFAQSARLVRPGGLLVICDDVKRSARSAEAMRAIEEFTRGWHVNSLVDRESLVALAHAAGFVHESASDLTSWLDINRVRDRVIVAAVALMKRLPLGRSRFDYIIGGHALQTCLARGWIAYELNVFRRERTKAGPRGVLK